MSAYITQQDYLPYVQDARLQMILQEDESLLDVAEETAIAVVKDSLYPTYDIDTIFSQTGTTRHKQVVRWVVCLVLYYVYERIPDKLIPERVINNYKEAIEKLAQIEDGQHSVLLPKLTDEEEKPLTKFRWGSEVSRGYH